MAVPFGMVVALGVLVPGVPELGVGGIDDVGEEGVGVKDGVAPGGGDPSVGVDTVGVADVGTDVLADVGVPAGFCGFFPSCPAWLET